MSKMTPRTEERIRERIHSLRSPSNESPEKAADRIVKKLLDQVAKGASADKK